VDIHNFAYKDDVIAINACMSGTVSCWETEAMLDTLILSFVASIMGCGVVRSIKQELSCAERSGERPVNSAGSKYKRHVETMLELELWTDARWKSCVW